MAFEVTEAGGSRCRSGRTISSGKGPRPPTRPPRVRSQRSATRSEKVAHLGQSGRPGVPLEDQLATIPDRVRVDVSLPDQSQPSSPIDVALAPGDGRAIDRYFSLCKLCKKPLRRGLVSRCSLSNMAVLVDAPGREVDREADDSG